MHVCRGPCVLWVLQMSLSLVTLRGDDQRTEACTSPSRSHTRNTCFLFTLESRQISTRAPVISHSQRKGISPWTWHRSCGEPPGIASPVVATDGWENQNGPSGDTMVIFKCASSGARDTPRLLFSSSPGPAVRPKVPKVCTSRLLGCCHNRRVSRVADLRSVLQCYHTLGEMLLMHGHQRSPRKPRECTVMPRAGTQTRGHVYFVRLCFRGCGRQLFLLLSMHREFPGRMGAWKIDREAYGNTQEGSSHRKQ